MTDPGAMLMLGILIGGVAAGVGALVAVRFTKRERERQFHPITRRVSATAAEAALVEMRRARDAGEFNADEEIIVARMERLAASRPRPEEP